MQLDGLEIDLAARAVRRGDHDIHLTPIEYKLLSTLLRHRGRMLTHQALLQQVWGPAYAHDTQTLRAHIANLRRKIDPAAGLSHIQTEHGIGYRFANRRPAETVAPSLRLAA